MLRSLMTAVTGVRAHQVMLDVTGNNIANVNTTGFKKDFTIFQDLLYQTSKGASGPGASRGGVNAAQVGLGVKVGAIETIHSQGFAQYTGNKLDMMISGEGYYVLRDGNSRIYSRAGNFTLDAGNTLVHSGTGYVVQGYEMERDPMDPTNFVKAGDISDVVIPIGRKMEARATTQVNFRCNLDSRTNPYLPIGYKDIPFGGARGNEAASVVNVGDVSYTLTAKTNLLGAANPASSYLTFNFDTVPPTNATGADIVFELTGIKDGKPVLAPVANTVTLPGSGITADVAYDSDTGLLKLTNPSAGGATLWETNVTSDMSYENFTVTTTGAAGGDYKFLVEFDESNLESSPAQMILWWQDPNAVAGTNPMNRIVINVPMKTDGTFDNITNLTTAIQGGLSTLPAGFTDNFQINVVADGRGLEFKTRDLATAAANTSVPFSVATQVTMGEVHQTKFTVFDCQGYAYTMEVQFKKISENLWRWEGFFPNDPALSAYKPSGRLVFDQSCVLVKPLSETITVPFSLLGRENSTIKLEFGGSGDVMEGVTQFASPSTTKAVWQDGYRMGVLKDFNVSQDGVITGIYDNDQTQPVYRMALAQFANPMGLEKVGDTMFRETINSGNARIGAAQEDGAGSIVSSTLEMSNVDLTEEFTRLIISQRGFQANTRVVTTSDQILEEVVNMKR